MDTRLKLNTLTHFTYGFIFSTFGPLIPYLSELTLRQQFEFNYIFALRGVAYMLAGIAHRTFLAKYDIEFRMKICLFIGSICFTLFCLSYNHLFLLAIVTFILNCCAGSMEVLVNVCLVAAKGDIKSNSNFSYALYGVGGILGPISVAVFGVHILLVIALQLAILTAIYHSYSSKFEDLQLAKDFDFSDNPQQNQQNLLSKPSKQLSNQKMSEKTEYALYGLFLLYSSISLSYCSWQPSFVVSQGISSKQTAAIAISLYSVFLTAFRFAFMFLKIKTSLLLRASVLRIFLTLFIATFLGQHATWYILFGTSFLMGSLYSFYIPSLFSLPDAYGKKWSPESTANTVIAYAFGEVVICAAIGYLMQMQPGLFYVVLLMFAFVNVFLLQTAVNLLKTEQLSLKQCQNSV